MTTTIATTMLVVVPVTHANKNCVLVSENRSDSVRVTASIRALSKRDRGEHEGKEEREDTKLS